MKREQILRLLPEVFQRTNGSQNPLGAFVDGMAALLTPIEDHMNTVDAVFDPHRTRDEFVPMLAHWVDLGLLWGDRTQGRDGAPGGLELSHARLRELVAAAPRLAKIRGTVEGLRSFLEIATGSADFQIEENPCDASGRPRPFHFVVRAPEEARRYQRLVERIVELEKPVYATCQTLFPENEEN